MIRVCFALLFAILVVSPSRAGGSDDLKAGLEAAQADKRDEAIGLLSRALQAGDLSPEEQVSADKARGGEYFAKSLVADAFGRRDEARRLRDSSVTDYTAALKPKPDDAALLAERGQSYHYNGQYVEAVADFEAAMRLKPSLVTLMQRADSYRANGDYDRAIADYTAAFGFDGKDANVEPWDIHNERAYAAFLATRFNDAAADFEQALTLGAKTLADDVLWRPYQTAWLHIARVRAGQNDAEELARNAAKIDLKQWPGTLIAFFLGQIKEEDIATPGSHGAGGRARECNMAFFIGETALAKGDAATAGRNFGQARGACGNHSIVYLAADTEAKRMKR